jgi:GNAT superfamily N-acetyltransferase
VSQVRPATATDIPELVELRALLYEEVGHAWGSVDPGWREACAAALEEALDDGVTHTAVVDGPTGLAACASGIIDRRLPGPYNPSGRSGHVLMVVTDRRYRGRGYGRAVMSALLDWFDERGVTRVDLVATSQGRELYRQLGFVDHPDRTMRRTR